jgi:hypothetical protein
LRENCLQCFETLIQRCPKDIAPHIDAIGLFFFSVRFVELIKQTHHFFVEALAIKYLSFDPNYAADSDEDEDDEQADDDMEEVCC